MISLDCSSQNYSCITSHFDNTISLDDSTITGNGSTPAIYLLRSTLVLEDSTINSTNSESITNANSHIEASHNANTIQGTIKCTKSGFGNFLSSFTTDGC